MISLIILFFIIFIIPQKYKNFFILNNLENTNLKYKLLFYIISSSLILFFKPIIFFFLISYFFSFIYLIIKTKHSKKIIKIYDHKKLNNTKDLIQFIIYLPYTLSKISFLNFYNILNTPKKKIYLIKIYLINILKISLSGISLFISKISFILTDSLYFTILKYNHSLSYKNFLYFFNIEFLFTINNQLQFFNRSYNNFFLVGKMYSTYLTNVSYFLNFFNSYNINSFQILNTNNISHNLNLYSIKSQHIIKTNKFVHHNEILNEPIENKNKSILAYQFTSNPNFFQNPIETITKQGVKYVGPILTDYINIFPLSQISAHNFYKNNILVGEINSSSISNFLNQTVKSINMTSLMFNSEILVIKNNKVIKSDIISEFNNFTHLDQSRFFNINPNLLYLMYEYLNNHTNNNFNSFPTNFKIESIQKLMTTFKENDTIIINEVLSKIECNKTISLYFPYTFN